MLYLEYNWTADCYMPRFGASFTDIRGQRSFATLAAAKGALDAIGLCLGARPHSRVWRIECKPESLPC